DVNPRRTNQIDQRVFTQEMLLMKRKLLGLIVGLHVLQSAASSDSLSVSKDSISDGEKDSASSGSHFTPYWAVQISGGVSAAKEVTRRHGFHFVGQILPDIYSFRHRRLTRRSASPAGRNQRLLKSDRQVLWAEQQVARRRVKRDGIPPSFPKHGDSWIRDSTPQWRSRYAPAWQPDSGSNMNDEKWHKMWYMNDESRVWDGLAAPSMNIRKAWQMGYRGQNVVVCVLDDGIEWKHPDLRRNYDRKASFDANSNDKDPSARPTKNDENKHGTRCAGQISALGNNRLCVPGIAHEARIGAIRMLDGEVTDTVETVSLSYQTHYIDIYSSSWGPEDDGKTVEGPGRLTQQAFQIGVQSGRVGLGSIYIWASGNGGQKGDNCNTDGYTNSIYTLSVNSVSEFGAVPWYSEPCSSTLAATYSSGEERRERAIITTDLHGRCTESHTGTSASAPIAAGIAALVLSASPSLTWRDMQHLVVRGANPSPYLKSREWLVNGVGRRVSHDFGFGLMDAAAMVSLALNWTRVPEQRTCELWLRTDRGHQLPADVPPNYDRTFRLYSDGCLGTRHRVLYLEHVQAKVSLLASVRGRVQLWLHSPLGTVSQLLTKRKFDQKGQAGFHEWPFMTVHNWGETSNGTWKLRVRCDDCRATLQSWSLLLHGTADLPAHQVMPLVPKPRRAAFSTGDDYGGGVAGADGTGWASRGGGRRETAAAAGAGSSYNKNNNNYYYYGVRYSPAAEVNHGGQDANSACGRLKALSSFLLKMLSCLLLLRAMQFEHS
ncbi:hypothetical protein BOX15_Mlig002553g2, partial [Macrostomum lignano]